MDYCEAVYPPSSFFKVVQNEVRYEKAFEVKLGIPKRQASWSREPVNTESSQLVSAVVYGLSSERRGR